MIGLIFVGLAGACAGQGATSLAGDHDHGAYHDDNPRPFDGSRAAMADVDAALAAATISGKRVLLVLGGNWCHDSRGLAAHFDEPELSGVLAEHYHLVWVDVGRRDRNLDVPKRFGVFGLVGTPTVLVLSPDGVLLNGETAHEWRRAASTPYAETLAYFRFYVN